MGANARIVMPREYWYFSFEGRFRDGVSDPGFRGVFSSCVVPEGDRVRARQALGRGLDQNEIELVEVLESFEYNGDELDPEDPANTLWISWHQTAKETQGVVFDVWHTFSDDDEEEV